MTGSDLFRGFMCSAIAAIGGYLLHDSDSILASIVAIFVLVTYGNRAFRYWGIE